MSAAPIVFVLGLPGQFYLAKGLADEFQRPVVGITSWGRTDELLTPERRAMFTELHSFPDYYLANIGRIRAMDRADLDRAQAALEQKLGVAESTTISYYDRALRWCGNYMKVRHYQLATLEFVDRFFSAGIQPAFFLDGVVTYLQHVLRAVCRKRGVPYFLTQTARLNGHYSILHENGQHVGMMETFAELQKGNDNFIDAAILKKADESFDAFLNKPVRPLYAQKNTTMGFQPGKLIKKIALTLRPEKISPSEKVLRTDRFMEYEFSPLRSLFNGLRNRIRRAEQTLLNVMDKAPATDVPYIYLPLHYAPEISDMYFGANYDHHAGFITQLARRLPVDLRLYAKEHTSMPGCRPTGFYTELNSLYNVRLIAPSVDTFTLTKNAAAVAAVTGTAGWEAYLLGKPVIALGDVFYNRLPGVYHAPLDNKFTEGFKKYLSSFKADPQERRNAYRAFYATCTPGTKGDISHLITEKQAEGNARLYAAGLRRCIEKWGHTMQGDFPEDIIPVSAREKIA